MSLSKAADWSTFTRHQPRKRAPLAPIDAQSPFNDRQSNSSLQLIRVSSSSRTAAKATCALKSAEYRFRFVFARRSFVSRYSLATGPNSCEHLSFSRAQKSGQKRSQTKLDLAVSDVKTGNCQISAKTLLCNIFVSRQLLTWQLCFDPHPHYSNSGCIRSCHRFYARNFSGISVRNLTRA